MQLRLASYKSWANTTDRSSRTAAARRASHHTRFLDKAREQYPDATEAEIKKVAEALKKAHYQELALRSAQARRIKRELAEQAKRRKVAQQLAEYSAGTDAA
jgi:translation initiation factor 2B subunit (eIF-2B alpha/beta/delta family)